MRQNLVIGSVIAIIFLLGMWGQYEVSPDNLGVRFTQAFYEIVLLFAVGGEWTLDISPLPWQIELARLIAPVATVMTILFVFVGRARVTIINYMVRYRKDHIVVGGLGWRAWQFIQTCDDPHKVVAVELNADSREVEKARQRGVSVIIGDVLDSETYGKVGLLNAKDLVAFTGNDGINVELALKARDYVRKTHPSNSHLRIHLHADEPKLTYRLEDYPKFYDEYSVAEISFFSVYDLSARILFHSYPPDLFADVFGQRQVHIALYAFERMALHILLEAARTCHFRNSSRTRFTIFDKDAVVKAQQLKNEYPHIEEICDFDFVPMEVNGQHDIDDLSTVLLQSITYHVICDDSDESNVNCALILRNALLKRIGCNAPIMVRMMQSSGLAQLLESRTGDPENPDGLFPFGMLDQVLQVDNIINERLDRRAKIIHQIYEDPSGGSNQISAQRLQQDWNDLPERKRKQNRLQADHLGVKLRAIACNSRGKPASGFAFAEQESELLAAMEHARWVATEKNDGWVYGPEKVEDAKISPYILPWHAVADSNKEEEIQRIRLYPTSFAQQAELHLCRQLIIGVTGHRLHKLDVNSESLIKAIEEVLVELKRKYHDRKMIVMSPLAEGADRLVARMAMETVGAFLMVPLPLPFDLYQTDFSSDDSVKDFKEMVGKAEYYYELPMKFGTREQLAVRKDQSSNELRNQQYALAGAYIVERSDELIAIWDGQPEKGTGGTAQVVGWRRAGRVDPRYVNEADFFQRPAMTEPLIISPEP
jgi:hypothetical protein